MHENGENMVTIHIKKWGNSLAVRLPQSLLAQLNLKEDSEVEISIDEGRLILSPVRKPKYTLDELLAKFNSNSLHEEIDFGAARGKEEW
jgi:antitoxin MazE